MVIFITNKSAYLEMENLIQTGNYSVWITANVLKQNEIEELWRKNIDLSVFDYEVDPNNKEDLECSLDTIKEHHPGKNIWVQFKSDVKN